MIGAAAVLLAVAVLALSGGAAVGAETGKAPPSLPLPGAAPHGGDLDCRNCHQGNHQGVVRMYLGLGGLGTPMIPSHMMQVRVQCVACHIQPKEEAAKARIVGQTFRPSEQACVNCHGERYRGMLGRWVDTLAKMRDIVAPKLAAVQAQLAEAAPKTLAPRLARARKLAGDAEVNLQFVALGKGVHNVFYAADLLKVSNGWLEEAVALLGKPAAKADDTLVRGGYCAVLCHQQARVTVPETVTFQKQKVPHAAHVSQFGAVCTACHSAEVHKAVTATAATCTSCHHGAQNERCDSCHRAQSAFYRGELKTALVKPEPNVMANAVSCTGCHDWTKKHSRQAVAEKCVGCHDQGYAGFVTEWTTGQDKESRAAVEAVKRAEQALARARRRGVKAPEAEALAKEAREALNIVARARSVHNPPAAEALRLLAQQKADEVTARLGEAGTSTRPAERPK